MEKAAATRFQMIYARAVACDGLPRRSLAIAMSRAKISSLMDHLLKNCLNTAT
jgi:hypothetical protein